MCLERGGNYYSENWPLWIHQVRPFEVVWYGLNEEKKEPDLCFLLRVGGKLGWEFSFKVKDLHSFNLLPKPRESTQACFHHILMWGQNKNKESLGLKVDSSQLKEKNGDRHFWFSVEQVGIKGNGQASWVEFWAPRKCLTPPSCLSYLNVITRGSFPILCTVTGSTTAAWWRITPNAMDFIHIERWHLHSIPILQQPEWSRKGDAENESIQDWYRHSIFPQTQSTQYSESGSFPGSGKRTGVWHWHDRLWQCEEML